MQKISRNIRKLIAFLMAMIMMICQIQVPSFAESGYSSTLNGWTVHVVWNNFSTDYHWNPKGDEKQQPKIITTYRLQQADQDYPIGSIRFTIPGIGNLNRDSLLKASQIAADKEHSEWSYTWDQSRDVYTFVNKFEIKAGESISGGFEMLWDFSARACENDFVQDKSPVFSLDTGENPADITMEPLHFQFHSEKDLYRVNLRKNKLTGEEYNGSDKDYIWYTMTAAFDKDWNSRGLYKSDFFVSVEIPEGKEYDDVKVIYEGKNIPLIQNDHGEYGFYLFKDKKGDIGNWGATQSYDFKVGFRREVLKENEITIKGHLDRLYQDESDWDRESLDGNRYDIPDAEISFSIDDYGFLMEGYLYEFSKWNTSYENYPIEHSEPLDYVKRMSATNLYNGKLVQFQLSLEANQNYTEKKLKTKTTVSSDSRSLSIKEMPVPDGIEDWNDIHWKEHGLTETSETVVQKIRYEDRYGDSFLATPSDAESDNTDGVIVPDIDILGSLTKIYDKASSLFSMTSYAANMAATPSEADKNSSNQENYKQNTMTLDDNMTWYSQIKEGQEYSLVMGDDKLAIFLNNGSIRNLTDEEYDIAYVTVPSDSRKYDYEIWGAYSNEINPDQNGQDTPFEDYVLLGEGNTEKIGVFQIDSGVKAVYVQVKDLMGNCDFKAFVGVRFHLDWATEQEKEFGERPDPENHLVNFAYLRALYVNEDNEIMNDIAKGPEWYEGSYGEELADRDFAVYQEYLHRGYSNVWIRSAITELKTESGIKPFTGGGKEGFSTTVTGTGVIKADNPGNLEKFSMYVSIPEGLEVDIDEIPVDITGSGVDIDGYLVNDFKNYATIYIRELNGKSFLVCDFDFTEAPLEISEAASMNISFPATLSYADYISCGNSYSVNTYLLIHDDGIERVHGSAIMSDAHDLDGDGNTEEKIAYSHTQETITNTINEWRQYVSKYVKSTYSAGYVTDTVTKLYNRKDTDEEKKKSDYSYRLDFALGSDNAKNIIFFDRIEQGAKIADKVDDPNAYTDIESEWQGQFVSVDTSQMERLKIIPTIYYSTNPNQELDLSAGGWSTEIPQNPGEVKAVAVMADTSQMEGGMMRAGQMAYVEIQMRAPEDTSLVGKRAVNQYTVQYDAHGFDDLFTGITTLSSSETYVRPLDTVGKIILQKVDADNVIRTNEDGAKHYAPLSGAKFQVYDGPGKAAKALFDEPKELNSAGRIVLKTMPFGTYFWEEVEAPAGYQRIEGRHPFEIDGITEIVNIENKRIPGSVTLTKQDADNVSYGPLSGTTYELFRSDGMQVFTDKDYQYSDSDSNSEFVTAEGGTFTVTNLPWGNYYFLEKEAPNGYELSNKKWEFSIGREQYDAVTNTVAVELETYDYEITTDLLLKKTDSVSKKPVRNAMYNLFKEGDTEDVLVFSGLKTNAAGELTVKGLKFGSYYFVETRNAGGYQMPDEAAARTETVTLDESTAGTEVKVFHSNDRLDGSVQLLKSDDANQLVGGAEYTLYYKADTSMEDVYEKQGIYVTNDDRASDDYGTISVSGLKWGSYYFVETKAPRGYEVSLEPIEFEVNAKSVQNTIYLETMDFRQKGAIRLIKTEKGNPNIRLRGAVYGLYKADGTPCREGEDYTLSGSTDGIITDKNGSVTISGLVHGGYFLKEITPPDGYSLSTDFIRFSITKENCDIVQEIIAEDEKGKANITINKEINEAHDTFGTPTFLFEIKRDDGKTYHQTITLVDGCLTGSVSFTVDQAHTYTIRELDVSRYTLTGIMPVENTLVVDNKKQAIADLRANTRAEVTFRNEINQYEKFSHVANATNIIKKDSYLTGIRVDYTGSNPLEISDSLPGYDFDMDVYTIPKKDLIVKAFYDDGTEKTLTASEYTLIDPIIDCSTNNESFTGTVTYTEAGARKSGTFQISMDYTGRPQRYFVSFELLGGTIIPDNETSSKDTLVIKVKDGSVVSRPKNDPVKEEYAFDGWYLDQACTIKATFTELITKDTTYYAKWTQNDPTVKYAVSLYGIRHDQYRKADGTTGTAGLTFGPATGASYIYDFMNHSPTGKTLSGNDHRCIHDDSWDTITQWSKKDPNVYEQCYGNTSTKSCTKSVPLMLDDPLKGNAVICTGDGAGSLYNSLNTAYTKWNAIKANNGGWPSSRIRAVLNGADTDTDTDMAGTDILSINESNALISAFPSILQQHIVPKAVYSDTIQNNISGTPAVTYDRLWLLSGKEMFAPGSDQNKNKVIRPNEGALYERQIALGITTTSYSKNIGYGDGGPYNVDRKWLRSLAREYEYGAIFRIGSGGPFYESAGMGNDIAPGFCLE